MKSECILVIGANGQIGSVLVEYLREIYGVEKVVASDIRLPEHETGLFEKLDATDGNALAALVKKYKVTQIYHLAAILSAKGEQEPLKTWHINMQTYFNVLEVARENNVAKVFYPSSIAVFGDNVDTKAEQWSYLDPATVYGISKAAGENWSNYYFQRYGMDIRSLRYPGIIGYQSMPGGGTTDYAVDIYHKAVQGEAFECFLEAKTTLPMIYISDAMDATVRLMEAPKDKITVRTSYNLAGISFSPEEVAESIGKIIPDFKISYKPDFRQKIAESWPAQIDDSQARKDWGWRPAYNLDKMTEEMIFELKKKYQSVKS
ncbi:MULTISPECIES: NAD-dependent epimerase/dehydratase family protein [Dyadobacter]|uniref:NAD-dependent epimerase/dehydratase family protein n=1 Tax=Dyadobacter chenhuakuii TaxID=2909339 RepID=A0ABY4XGV2_9BACT|nr:MULTISPECIES: NAD-dependent epimerase/dehydratase family protein [Dyadobacter]MCF2495164.1 NAD-dependent epimerase/dehydratase family protein [Dyadobacter chenhuakuii]MCF2516253.1 NAD-dependent epimerase/dehydratase family protein [Dyadobacter sp. CY351]USJ29207.1 NAD-dependent epimerase/dehydratase family protein [Dyadobacter chenhuakuii]